MQNVYVRDLLENAKFAHNYSINKKKKSVMFPAYGIL